MSGNLQNQISKNLQDQSQNFGQELLTSPQGGALAFVNAQSGLSVNRGFDASSYVLQNGPLDNSFQLNPNQYAVGVALFQAPGVSTNLSNTFGAIAAATAQQLGVSPGEVYKNGIMSEAMLENVNGFNSVNTQVGYNSGSTTPPYAQNLLLGAKIVNQVV